MSLDNRPENHAEIGSVDELVASCEGATKDPSEFRVGMEHEKFGLLSDTLEPVPYFGERSIEAVFRLGVERGFEPYAEDGRVIALLRDSTSITLEPGGQLELSGAVLGDNHATCKELTDHQTFAHDVADELGIVWIGGGHHPFATRDEIPWMPKKRYEIMREYLPTRGSRALDMMKRTATVQANFDFADEADMARKMRTAMGVSPLVSAIYANSPLVEGKVTGWVSERQRIWRDVDPDRTGLLPFVFEEGFGFRDYVDWVLDVPMFFLRREGRYLGGLTGTPFRHFLEHGWEGQRARFSDWDLHLTTVFPEVRLKSYLEVRGADGCNRDLNCALPALWKGLLYDEEAREAAWSLVGGWTLPVREQLLVDVARDGLEASVEGRPVLELSCELAAISREGLRRQRQLDGNGRDETHYLDPVDAVLADGVSPGRVTARLWEGELGRDRRKLVAHCRF